MELHYNLGRKNSLSSTHQVIPIWHNIPHHHLMSSTHQSTQPESAHIDPMDYETPGDTTNENPMMNAIESEATVFAKAIDKLVKSITTSSNPKLWEPDPFDSSNPKRLWTFILQCKQNFRDWTDLFEDGETKSTTPFHI